MGKGQTTGGLKRQLEALGPDDKGCESHGRFIQRKIHQIAIMPATCKQDSGRDTTEDLGPGTGRWG